MCVLCITKVDGTHVGGACVLIIEKYFSAKHTTWQPCFSRQEVAGRNRVYVHVATTRDTGTTLLVTLPRPQKKGWDLVSEDLLLLNTDAKKKRNHFVATSSYLTSSS